MKILPNPLIKRNNNQIQREQIDKKYIPIMIWCPRYKINLNPNMKENCLGCIFWDDEKTKCFYNEWFPGLKKEKNE